MIPKIIHYCWLSDDPIPENLQNYINGWSKIMPDYTIIKWDRHRFNLDEHPFAKAAFDDGKYAFAADYIRVYALYTMGGIYLDSDVEVYKPFDQYLDSSFFTSFETHISTFLYKRLIGRYIDGNGNRFKDFRTIPGIGMQAAIIGSEKESPFITKLFDFYSTQTYQTDLGAYRIVATTVFAQLAEPFGFRYVDELQELKDHVVVYPSHIFSSLENFNKDKAVALHVCYGGWVSGPKRLKKIIKKIPFVRDLYLLYFIITKVSYFKSQIPEGMRL